jgi:DNA polymerase III subunit beta
MKFNTEREKLLGPLQGVIGVVERRQTMPILANVLLAVRAGKLSIAASDLEVDGGDGGSTGGCNGCGP